MPSATNQVSLSRYRRSPERIKREKAVPTSQKVAERIARNMDRHHADYCAASWTYQPKSRWTKLTIWFRDRKDIFWIDTTGAIRRAENCNPVFEIRRAA